MKALHQLVPVLRPGDAVSAHALQVQALLREVGVESDIFVEDAHPDLRSRARLLADFPSRHRDVAGVGLMYQMAIGSASADFLLRRPERKLVNYHNITPESFFRRWNPQEVTNIRRGRRQLHDLARAVELGLAVSEFNRRELDDAGYAATAVAPLLLDFHEFDADVDRAALDRLTRAKESGGADLLFVGRLSPHKAQHDLVKAFAVYRRVHDPQARLHLVGGWGPPAYLRALREYVDELGLADSVDLPGAVPHGELVAYYRTADAFVCLSEHEGFCIPLLEAMYHHLPVVAFDAAAVSETLAGAGVLLPHKAPATVAGAIERVVRDRELREALREVARERLDHYGLDRARRRVSDALAPVLEDSA